MLSIFGKQGRIIWKTCLPNFTQKLVAVRYFKREQLLFFQHSALVIRSCSDIIISTLRLAVLFGFVETGNKFGVDRFYACPLRLCKILPQGVERWICKL